MSNIDKRALREAAEKATPGNWWIDSHGQAMVSFIENDVLEVFATDNKRAAVRHEDTGNLSRWRNDNDATFIATADPATVLALLDELEAKETENERMALELLNRSGEIEGLRQRIAELESREINLPPYSFFDFKQGSPFKSGAYCHIDSVNKELSKHCIKMIAAAGKGE
ncbi:ead/Ea22-like family protein [Enterobacter roggenkampii]|nr:ead/Ea22-like family protein [Enterobacter roggenkampii]